MAREPDYPTVQSDMAVAAEMVSRCCQACLVGPSQAEEMNDPSNKLDEAVNYALRRYNILQKNEFFGVVDPVAPLPGCNPRNGLRTTTSIGPNAFHYLRDVIPVVSGDGSIWYRSGVLHSVGEPSHGPCPRSTYKGRSTKNGQ
jgi:hypothetical protein